MKHATSLHLARHGAKIFLGVIAMLVFLYAFNEFETLKWLVGAVIFFIAMLAYPRVERFFEETFEIVET